MSGTLVTPADVVRQAADMYAFCFFVWPFEIQTFHRFQTGHKGLHQRNESPSAVLRVRKVVLHGGVGALVLRLLVDVPG